MPAAKTEDKEAKEVKEAPEAKPLGKAEKPDEPLTDQNTGADNMASPGQFCKIIEHDEYEGEFAVLVEDVPDSDDVVVRLHRAPGLRLTVPYSSLVSDNPYAGI